VQQSRTVARKSQPPGTDVGDVPDELGAWRVGGEVACEQVGQVRHVAGHGRDGPPRARLAGDQAQVTHDLPDRLVVGIRATAGQVRVDAPVPVGAVGGLERERDQRLQPPPAQLGGRGRTATPLVVPGPGDPRPPAHALDPIVAFFATDERVLHAHFDFLAKKAVAFPRNSFSIRNSRTSRSSSFNRARSDNVNSGSSPA
jgi:hypothetical protein